MEKPLKKCAFVNCDIYTGAAVEYDKAVITSGSKIAALVGANSIPSDCEIIDLKGMSVAPGFIDVQVNGGGGVLFNDSPTVDAIRTMVEAHRRYGSVNILPTFITGTVEGMKRARDAVVEYCKTSAGVLGIHFEGPFIAEAKAGVHDKAFIRSPNEIDIATIAADGNSLTLCTLAPEVAGCDTIARLADRGVIVAIGHTSAAYQDAMEAFSSGACCVTHLYNAMSQLGSREPGVVGAALAHTDSWAGIIADGYHVHFASIGVAYRAKPKGKLFLVTDAMPPVGADDPKFTLGPYSISVKDGRCITDKGLLAGSALDMATAVRNCIQKMGIPKDEALRMASTYPASFLRVDDRLGHIAPEYAADLCVFDNQIHITAVVVSGRIISFI